MQVAEAGAATRTEHAPRQGAGAEREPSTHVSSTHAGLPTPPPPTLAQCTAPALHGFLGALERYESGLLGLILRAFIDLCRGPAGPGSAGAASQSGLCALALDMCNNMCLQEEADIASFCENVERSGEGWFQGGEFLLVEDEMRPADGPGSLGYKQAPRKESGNRRSNRYWRSHVAVKWYRDIEAEKGSGRTQDGGFADWFVGMISRQEAERLLSGQASGTFLIRIADEDRRGYSLSMMFQGRCKHFQIDHEWGDDPYAVVGNDHAFPSLNGMVDFHLAHPLTEDGDMLLFPCPTPTDYLDGLMGDDGGSSF